MRTFVIASLAFLAATPLTARAQSDERQKIDTTFAFEKNGYVDLGVVSGEIVVTGWTKPEVKLYATIETGYWDASFSSTRIRVQAKSRRNKMGHHRIEISVPIGTEVRANSVSGNIAVRGSAAPVQVNTVSGDVEVRDAGDNVEMHAVSGELRAEKLRGRVRASTVSGDILLDDVTADVRAKTVSGELKVRGQLGGLDFESVSGDFEFRGDIRNDGTYSATTHSGDVRVTLPSNLAANLDLKTFSGDLRTEFPLTLEPGERPGRKGREMRTTINGGGARISLSTFSGDITIAKGASRSAKEEQ